MGSSGSNPDAEFDLNGSNQVVAGLSLTGTASKNSVNNSATTAATLTINPRTTSTFAGMIKGNLALTKTGASTQALSGANTYTGATTINAGRLVLGANNALPATAVSIAAASLDAATFTNTLGALNVTDAATINLGDGAALAFANSSAITWTGTLTITGSFVSGSSIRFGSSSTALTASQLAKISASGLSGFALNTSGFLTASTASNYASWATNNAATTTPTQDQDNDGVSNAVEYVLGGSSSSNDVSKLPVVSLLGDNIVYSFQRSQASINAFTSLNIQVGGTLEAWLGNYSVGVDTASSSAGVIVTKGVPLGFDTVTLSIPRAPDLQKFVRLRVTITP
jgi:autotransporter-associated beta strand protein